MFNPERPNNEPRREAEQIDFFGVLESVVPNEDIVEIALDQFGTKVRIEPTMPQQFEISNAIAQMTATVHYDATGSISNISIERWGESDPIEGAYQDRFRRDAERVLQEYREELGLGTTH